jgi:NAD(P)-dependent dehydrogenase (short-subunit alcohol dehydrogenase family)
MDLQLKNKRVVVTGGSRGIGLAIATAFAREGAQPQIVSRSQESLDKAAVQIKQQTGVDVQTLSADMATAAGVQALMQAAGAADIVVNNAGAIPGGSLADIDDARWRQSWELKLFGYINIVRAMLARMESEGRAGVIANIIGMAGAAPRNEYLAGSTANAALMAFTQAVGAASVRSGIRVFGINPSPTRSDRMETMLRAQAEKKWGDAGRWMELTSHMPFGRLMEPMEVADLTVFGCSPLSAYLSGTVINLDGGQMYASPK